MSRRVKKLKKRVMLSAAIIVFFVILMTGGIAALYRTQTKPVTESTKTEMKKVPPDVKAEIEKKPVIASISATIRVPILMYHYVEYVQDKKDTTRQALNINPYTFEKQLQTLIQGGYTFMTAKELGMALDGAMQLPQKPVLLTFDDGHWGFDTVVLPILKKYHAKATAYIIPGFLGGSDFMTKDQLQDVVDSGLVDVGAHTVHHVSLKGKLQPVVQNEVSKSKTMLEEMFHMPVVSFAYPNGAFDSQATKVVENAGFTTSVSTIPGIMQNQQNRFFLYRLRPGYRVGDSLLTYLQFSKFKAF